MQDICCEIWLYKGNTVQDDQFWLLRCRIVGPATIAGSASVEKGSDMIPS